MDDDAGRAQGALLATLPSSVELRRARAEDLPALVALLADDPLGAGREGTDLAPYVAAFEAIDSDPRHLLVAGWSGGELVATLQLSFLPGLARNGAWRAQVEAVRVAAGVRGAGLGAQLLTWAIEEARRRGCALVQLTTDRSRVDAHRFYARLGFVASHEGFKLTL